MKKLLLKSTVFKFEFGDNKTFPIATQETTVKPFSLKFQKKKKNYLARTNVEVLDFLVELQPRVSHHYLQYYCLVFKKKKNKHPRSKNLRDLFSVNAADKNFTPFSLTLLTIFL
jgi:hypothetical protein